jgi:hypothetical protein
MIRLSKPLVLAATVVVAACSTSKQGPSTSQSEEESDIVCLYADEEFAYGELNTVPNSEPEIVQRCTSKNGKPYWETLSEK